MRGFCDSATVTVTSTIHRLKFHFPLLTVSTTHHKSMKLYSLPLLMTNQLPPSSIIHLFPQASLTHSRLSHKMTPPLLSERPKEKPHEQSVKRGLLICRVWALQLSSFSLLSSAMQLSISSYTIPESQDSIHPSLVELFTQISRELN